MLTPTGRLFVSVCCEPVPGSFQEVVDGEAVGEVRYDHALALSPDGTELAAVGYASVDKRPLDGHGVLSAGDEGGRRMPYEVSWLRPDRLAVLEQREGIAPDASELHLTLLDADMVGWATAPTIALRAGLDGTWPSLAGRASDGSILVLDREVDATTLVAFDPETLARRPEHDVPLPGPALDAWSSATGTIWIDEDGALHVGDAVVDGRYRWARPAA